VAAEFPEFTDEHRRRCANVEVMRGQNRFVQRSRRDGW